MSAPIGQGFQPPVVQHEHIDLGQALEELGIATVRMGDFEIGEQPGQALVEHMIAVPTGLMAQGTGDVGLADTDGAQNEHIAMLADPVIAGQALQEAAVEAPGSLPVQIFQRGGLFQPGRAQTRLQAFLIAQAPFRVEEDPETFQEGMAAISGCCSWCSRAWSMPLRWSARSRS